jgi:tetratricopeptide (TPR) repeat protein
VTPDSVSPGAAGPARPGRPPELGRAAAMIEVGRFDDAARLLARIVASEPDGARAWSLMSRAHLGAGRWAEALAAAHRAIAISPADHWPFRLASTALVSLGRSAEAVTAALEACRLAPGVWRSHVCLAQAATAAGQPGRAAQAAATALALAPDEPDVQFTAGKVALSTGDLARARSHQQAALAADPDHSAAINELGRISLREQDIGGAAGWFLRAARAAPGVAIFGRNTEIALAKVLTNITVLVSVVLAAAIVLPFLVGAGTLPDILVLAVLSALTCGYAVRQLRRVPPEGRRHLARMLRRRHWLGTIAAIAAAIDGPAVLAALLLRLDAARGSTTWPALIAITGIAVARPLVTSIIRVSRRTIR